MEVKEIQPVETESYKQAAAKWGTLFSDPSWAACFNMHYKKCGIFDNSGVLIGGFVFAKNSMKGFPFYTNLPFTPNIALFYNNPANNPANRLGTDKEVLDAVARFFRGFSIPVQRYCLPPFIRDMQPFAAKGFKVIPHLTYHIDLTIPEATILANMSSKLRNNLKKVVADGVVIRKLEDYQPGETMILNTYSRNKLGIDTQQIRNILHQFANQGNSFAFAAFQNDIMIAVSFFLFDKTAAFYMLGGFHDELKHEGAGAATIFEGIRESKAKGLKVFDFEGSMIPRIERYFRGFGGKIVDYYTINRAPFIMEVLLKMVKREIF